MNRNVSLSSLEWNCYVYNSGWCCFPYLCSIERQCHALEQVRQGLERSWFKLLLFQEAQVDLRPIILQRSTKSYTVCVRGGGGALGKLKCTHRVRQLDHGQILISNKLWFSLVVTMWYLEDPAFFRKIAFNKESVTQEICELPFKFLFSNGHWRYCIKLLQQHGS